VPTSDKRQAASAESAQMVRELVRRLDAAASARRRRDAEIHLAASQAAIEECLDRVDVAQLALEELRADPRVSRIMAGPLEGPGLSGAGLAMELRASMGLADRAPTSYETSMPAVHDLSRVIGLRSS
jgi:hypothetical protein